MDSPFPQSTQNNKRHTWLLRTFLLYFFSFECSDNMFVVVAVAVLVVVAAVLVVVVVVVDN